MSKRVKANQNYFTSTKCGEIYNVKEEDENCYRIVDDEGDLAWIFKYRFDELESDIYKSWEIARMLNEGTLKEGTILKWEENSLIEYTKVYTVKGKTIRDSSGNEMGCSMFTSHHNYIVIENTEKEVTFDEAIKSGKRIRYEYEDAKDGFEPLSDCLEILSQKYTSDKIRDIITYGKWFIKE